MSKVRIRKTEEVTCKACYRSYSKREDTIKNWSGVCRQCVNRSPERRELSKRTALLTRSIYGPIVYLGDRPGINGKKNPFYGRKHTKKTLAKMSGRVSNYKGSRHWKWNGGITCKSKLERTKFLKYTQPKVLFRDNYTCQVCKQYGGNLQVDHIRPWATNIELRFEMSNCRTVCMSCHYYLTYKKKMPEGIVWGNNLSRRVAK